MRVRSSIVMIALLLSVVALPAPAEAQLRQQAIGSRFWVDVNFGAAFSGADTTSFSFDYGQEWPNNPGHSIITATYGKPSTGYPFDFGGGYMFTNRFGVGASWSRHSVEDAVGLTADIPDVDFPGFPNGVGTSQSDPLKRSESIFNISAMFLLMQNDRMELRAYAGPSHFGYKATMIYDISWNQTFNATSSDVTITGYDTREVGGDDESFPAGSGWGFHAGADFAWMFTSNFGVGAGLRWAQGKVTLEREPLSEVEQEITVGGVQVLFGARFRFGRR